MRLQDHPGYLGLTSKGVIAIHADWPVYPEEHSADLALLWLTAFPQGTRFKQISDIDRCTLFVADVKLSNQRDLFDEQNLHVAVWHDDLLDLSESGLIDGVSTVSERRWEELKRAGLPAAIHRKLADGTLEQVQTPSLSEYDEEDLSWPEFASGGTTVTVCGRDRVAALLAEAPDDLSVLGSRVASLLALGFFDTAVREACVRLEHSVKTWLKSDRWGDRLVEEFADQLCKKPYLPNAYVQAFRGEIRLTFKFIRNDLMHNFVDMDETQCRAALYRVARVQTVVDQVTAGA